MMDSQLSTARSMQSLITSKRFISTCFAVLVLGALFQILVNSNDLTSFVVAVVPAVTVIAMAWLTLMRLAFTKSEHA